MSEFPTHFYEYQTRAHSVTAPHSMFCCPDFISWNMIEAETEMAYVTSIERVGEARGKEIGQKSGQTEMLRRLLTHKFGPLPNWVDTRLAEADKDQILTWADRVLDEASLQAVFQP